MDPLHYIDASINLATEQRGKPRQVYLRRAISTAYYGMFHTVSKTYADALIGTSKTRNDNAWLQAYRSLVHSQIARCSNRTEIRNQFSSEMQKFFTRFRTYILLVMMLTTILTQLFVDLRYWKILN